MVERRIGLNQSDRRSQQLTVYGCDLPEEMRWRAITLAGAIPETHEVRIVEPLGIDVVGHDPARKHDVVALIVGDDLEPRATILRSATRPHVTGAARVDA